jgi:hypothetical protein
MDRRHHQDLCFRGMNPNEACALALRAAAGQGGVLLLRKLTLWSAWWSRIKLVAAVIFTVHLFL